MKDEKVKDAALASRLFQALCTLYPDRYIAMTLPNDSPNVSAGAAYDNNSGSSAGRQLTRGP
jgi:hypothetical protein